MSNTIAINTQINITRIETKPFEGQKPGTSGLRKQTKIFSQDHYVENFIQSYFLSFRRDELAGYYFIIQLKMFC
jgi:phosphoglucomutase